MSVYLFPFPNLSLSRPLSPSRPLSLTPACSAAKAATEEAAPPSDAKQQQQQQSSSAQDGDGDAESGDATKQEEVVTEEGETGALDCRVCLHVCVLFDAGGKGPWPFRLAFECEACGRMNRKGRGDKKQLTQYIARVPHLHLHLLVCPRVQCMSRAGRRP